MGASPPSSSSLPALFLLAGRSFGVFREQKSRPARQTRPPGCRPATRITKLAVILAPKNRVAPRSLRVSTGNSEEDHGNLMNAVTTLDSSITRIALLYSSDGSLSSHVLELADHLNGTYPNLPDDTKLYWLERIQGCFRRIPVRFRAKRNDVLQ